MTVVFCALGALLALYFLLSYILFRFACRRMRHVKQSMKDITSTEDAVLAPYRDIIEAGKAFLDETPHEEIYMTSYDGLRLRGVLYEHPAARGVMVACHGYRSNSRRDFGAGCPFYYSRGLSILLIDERACTGSEGTYITFGVRESRDVRDWCVLMTERFPGLPILPAGISMGAAAVLMTADDLPLSVPVLLTDCGFTSPAQELRYVARRYMTAPSVVLMPGVGLWCRLLAGFGLRERAADAALKKCPLPVFFAHGEADGLVPHECSIINRAACSGPTTFFSVPGADHGLSYLVDTEGYQKALDEFLDKYVFQNKTLSA